jgi:LacI family transcriptional regulator
VKRSRHVGIPFRPPTHYTQGVLIGIWQWFRLREGWALESDVPPGEGNLEWIARRKWDGFLGYVSTASARDFLVAQQIPVVNFSNSLPAAGDTLPRVINDDLLTGRMVADHFLQGGVRRFAYCGPSDPGAGSLVNLRGTGFSDRLREAGFEAGAFAVNLKWGKHRWLDPDVPDLPGLIRKGSTPVGVFCSNDFYAKLLVRYCLDHDIRVPDQVAIVGVDNSDISEHLTALPISSVELQLAKIGYTASEVLAEIIEGKAPPREPIRIPPKCIVVRQSSDLAAVQDPLLARALKLIHEQACKPLQIADIARQAGVSRRLLEMRFRDVLGRSPYAEVLRCRVERAKLLLCDTDETVAEVAYTCGFEQPKLLHGAFKKSTGLTPAAFRRNFRHPRN